MTCSTEHDLCKQVCRAVRCIQVELTMTPPAVSSPRDKGATSSNSSSCTRSLPSPERMAACAHTPHMNSMHTSRQCAAHRCRRQNLFLIYGRLTVSRDAACVKGKANPTLHLLQSGKLSMHANKATTALQCARYCHNEARSSVTCNC